MHAFLVFTFKQYYLYTKLHVFSNNPSRLFFKSVEGKISPCKWTMEDTSGQHNSTPDSRSLSSAVHTHESTNKNTEIPGDCSDRSDLVYTYSVAEDTRTSYADVESPNIVPSNLTNGVARSQTINNSTDRPKDVRF